MDENNQRPSKGSKARHSIANTSLISDTIGPEISKSSVSGYSRPTKAVLERRQSRSIDGFGPRHCKQDGKIEQIILEENFKKKVEIKQGRYEQLLRSKTFNIIVVSLIIANAISIGVETDSDERDAWYWLLLEIFFIIGFSIELALRMTVEGKYFLWDFSNGRPDFGNLFDAFLVASGVIDIFITLVGGNETGLEIITTLRVIRLCRLARLARLVTIFREMWLFVCGLSAAVSTFISAFALLGVIIFISATFLVRTIGYTYAKDMESEDYDPDIALYFKDVGTAGMSLFQIITLDDWTGVANPVLKKVPGMWFFFVLFIGFCSYAIMAVIIAIITEALFVAAKAHEEETRSQTESDLRSAIAQIHKAFLAADLDGNGLLSQKEFIACLSEPSVINWLQNTGVSIADAEEMFDILDYDQTGFLTSHEFVEGCLRSRGPAKAKDLLDLECGMYRQLRSVKETFRTMEQTVEGRQREMMRVLNKIDQKMLCIVKATAMVNPTVSAWMSPLFDD